MPSSKSNKNFASNIEVTVITVMTCTSREEASVIVSKLQAFGIEAMIFADDESGLVPGMALVNGVDVRVFEKDFDEAKKVLKEA